jgi:hypothetical protein
MPSTTWRLLTALALLAPAGLAGCNRAQSIVFQETRADERPPTERVARGKADAGDKADPKKEDPEPAKEGFRFPDDKGGELLGRLLQPSVDGSALKERAQAPRRLPGPTSLEAPALALPPAQVSVPRAALEPKRPALQPRLVLDDALDGDGAPSLPEVRTFFTGEKTKDTTGLDVNRPPPLPVLGQPTPDRASLEDPTIDESIQAAVAATVPLRVNPVPFQRQSIPDPFENYNPVRLSDPSPEDSTPPVGPARNPKP